MPSSLIGEGHPEHQLENCNRQININKYIIDQTYQLYKY